MEAHVSFCDLNLVKASHVNPNYPMDMMDAMICNDGTTVRFCPLTVYKYRLHDSGLSDVVRIIVILADWLVQGLQWCLHTISGILYITSCKPLFHTEIVGQDILYMSIINHLHVIDVMSLSLIPPKDW